MYSFAVERGLLELLKLAIMGHAIKAKLMFCSLYVFFLFPAGVLSVPAAAASLVFVLSGGCQQPVLCAWSGAVVLMSVTLVWFKDQ